MQSYEVNLQGNRGDWGEGMTSGYETSDGYRVNDDKDKRRFGGKVAWTGQDRTHVSLTADYLLDERGNPGLPEYPTPHARQRDETFSSVLVAQHNSWLSKTTADDSQRENEDPDRKLDTFLRVQKLGEEVSGRVPLWNWDAVNCGAGFEHAQAWGEKIERREEESFWVFAAKDIALESIPLTFSVGLRGNFYSEFGEAFNPELKATAKHRWGTLGLTANRTNNIPSFMQRYNETSSTRPNPDLTMEEASNFNVSITPGLPPSFSLGVSLFYNLITNRITYVRGDGGLGRYENFGEVTYRGVEGSLGWEPFSSLKCKCSRVFLDAVDEATGNRLAAKPRHQLNTDIMWSPTDKISLALSTTAVSKQFTRSDNTESVPGYFTADVRSEYRWRKGISFFTEVKNLTDREYFYGDGYPAPPLTWIAGISCQF